MSDLPRLLAQVQDTANEMRDLEEETEEARQRFYDVMAEAHAAGASYADLGRLVGLTRQRIARIVSGR
jgi:hypothetical protein